MEIIQCSMGGWKIAFKKAPPCDVFQWGKKQCKLYFIQGFSYITNLKSEPNVNNIYYKCNDEDDCDFIVQARLAQILDDDFSPIKTKYCFANNCFLNYYKYDCIYESSVGISNLKFITDSHSSIVKYNTNVPVYTDFEIATIANSCSSVNDGTNICIKCGYNNPYIDPVENYICTQCKIRNEAWA